MSDAIKKLHDYLAKSPSVVYPEDVLAYLPAIEAENVALRELVRGLYKAFMHSNCYRWCGFKEPCNHILDCKCQWYDQMRELGVEEE